MTQRERRRRFWIEAGLVVVLVAHGVAPAQSFAPPFEAATVVADHQTRFEGLVDYDADGKTDAISVWFPDPMTITVRGYRNDGAGQLLLDWSVTYPGIANFPFTGPKAVIGTGDFNADGLGDFVLTLNQYVGYWISNGAAVLPTVTWLVPEVSTVNELVAADFDGDGRTDVAVLVGTDLKLWMTQPSGPPVMTSSVQAVTSGQAHIFATEANGDGLPDVGVLNWGGLMGTGALARLHPAPAGILQTAAIFGGFVNTANPVPASGDVDGDGDVDLVAFSMGTPTSPAHYQVARRTGPSSFLVESALIGGPATHLVDLDLDGDLDGACCGGGGPSTAINSVVSKFELSFNDGTGQFASAFEIAGLGATHLAGAVDLEGDGDIDLVAGRCINYGRGPGAQPPFPNGATTTSARDVLDADGDGDPDVSPGIATAQMNFGNGLYAPVPVIASTPPPGTTWAAPGFPGDFDGDGDVDLLVDALPPPSQPPNATHLLLNVGCGAYVDAGPATPSGTTMIQLPGLFPWVAVPETPENCLTSDLDGDGDVDLIVRLVGGAFTTTANSKVWWNQGGGSFLPGQDLGGFLVVHAADIDQDGIVDLVAHQHVISGFSDLVWMKGLGATFQLMSPAIDTDTHLENRPAVADFDGDGDLDVFSVGNVAAKRYTNLGNGVFSGPAAFLTVAPPPTAPIVVFPRLAFTLDVDGDGLPDVITTPIWDAPNGMGILLNPVLNSASPASAAPLKQVFQPRAFADVDGDGDDDALGATLLARNAKFGQGAGSRVQYGIGIAGSGGIVPIVGEVGPFRVGESGQLRIRGGLGGASGMLAFGLAPANVPVFNGTLLVTPDVLIPIQLGGAPGVAGAGSLTISWITPPLLAGVTLYKQVGFTDPGAAFGISASNGLRVEIGP